MSLPVVITLNNIANQIIYEKSKEEAMQLSTEQLKCYVEGYFADRGKIKNYLYTHSMIGIPLKVKAFQDVLKQREELSDKL